MNSIQPDQSPNESQERPLTLAVQNVFVGLQKLLRSEIRLARAELQETARTASRHLVMTATFGLIALLGVLPLIAFFVIGLGRLLNDNYWLSSLIVSICCITIGGVLAYIFARRFKTQNLSLSVTRNSLQNEAHLVRDKVHEISDAFQRRAS